MRPEIQVETAVWPLRLPPVERPVISFVAEAFNRPPEVPSIPCVALAETVAEKFVALTRQAGAEIESSCWQTPKPTATNSPPTATIR